jgi:putative molybdopterin biosynthesis protein
MDGALLDTEEAAALLKVHPKHMYRLLRRGLPGLRVGREWRFDRNDLLRWAGSDPTEAAATETPPLLAANGDVAVEILLSTVNEATPWIGFVQADRDGALESLRMGRALLAGCHGKTPPEQWDGARLARIHLVNREFGLVFRPSLGNIEVDLASMRWASRPVTAGIRAHVEAALRKDGIAPDFLEGATTWSSHRDVVLAIVRGEADFGFATRAWADRAGVGFQSLGSEAYGLVLRAQDLGDSRVVRVCEVAQSAAYRAALQAIPGYDPEDSGALQYHF